jgi:membrane protein DedA with SNARE-associated domain
MKTHLKDDRNLLFQLSCKTLKYFLLTLLGFALACIVSKVLGTSLIVAILLSQNVWEWFFRIAVLIFCLFVIAIVFESSR